MNEPWFKIKRVREIDTPALLIFKDRVSSNIEKMISIAGSPGKLQPHVKTYKMPEVVKMQMAKGIDKFKCATVAEAEMLAMVSVPNVLLAYQPTGPKIDRMLALVKKYPKTRFSVLLDNRNTAAQLSIKCQHNKRVLDVLIDINNGNNRTGIKPDSARELINYCDGLPGINLTGLHIYDGHIRAGNPAEREKITNKDYEQVTDLLNSLGKAKRDALVIIAGGSPTFRIHAKRTNVICSPGTTLFWDAGYGEKFGDMPFEPAAVLITRVISKPDDNLLCLDLGHKSVAAENPIENRVRFLNVEGLKPVSQSEEHLVVENTQKIELEVGDLIYGIPYHICPTTALYNEVLVVEENRVVDTWKVAARGRKITI